MTLDITTENVQLSDQMLAALDAKVLAVFGHMAIDKRRLPMSQLQKRGVPAYVGEWILDSIVPGSGALTWALPPRPCATRLARKPPLA